MSNFGKSDIHSTDCSASLLPNNLTLQPEDGSDGRKFAVIHKHLAIVGQLGSQSFTQLCHGKLGEKDPTTYLTQVKWCELDSVVIIVLTSYRGIKMYTSDGTKNIYSNKFETPPGAFSNRFAKGIASADNCIYIGTSEGTILEFRVLNKEGSSQVTLAGQMQGHKAAISDLVIHEPKAKTKHLVSADEHGLICVWEDRNPGAKPVTRIRDPSGMPCLCLTCWKSFVIGGFANGQVRFFDIRSGTKTLELAVHARPVTAIDLAPSAGLLLTASEDSVLSLWQLPISNSESLLHMEVIENALLCGAKFLNPEGTQFAVTAYDHSNIYTFTKLSTPF